MKKKNTPPSGLRKIIFDTFQFLITEFDYELIEQTSEVMFYKLVFKNSTTGVVVMYESREQYIDIDLYKLIDGQIVKNVTHALISKEKIKGFRLDSIMKARNIRKQILPIHKYGEDSEFHGDNGLSKWVALFAENLRSYAADILNGDFSSFEELDAQFRENYYKNWGTIGKG